MVPPICPVHMDRWQNENRPWLRDQGRLSSWWRCCAGGRGVDHLAHAPRGTHLLFTSALIQKERGTQLLVTYGALPHRNPLPHRRQPPACELIIPELVPRLSQS